MNFKIKTSEVFFNYTVENTMRYFTQHIRQDIENPIGCYATDHHYFRIKDKTIKSRLIKIMFGG